MKKSGPGYLIGAVIIWMLFKFTMYQMFPPDRSTGKKDTSGNFYNDGHYRSVSQKLAEKEYREELRAKGKLKNAARAMSAGCPMMIDANTRLERIIPVGTNGFQYNYTLLNYSRDSINHDALKTSLTPGLTDYIKNTRELAVYRNEGFDFRFHYSDKAGRPLFILEITPEMYR